MSTRTTTRSSTLTALTTTAFRLTAGAALVLASTFVGAGISAASDGPTNAGDDYVAALVAKAQEAKPYSQADDYVDTLVYWHHHPDWGFGGAGA